MKRFAVLSALLLFSSVSHAQNAPSDSAKNAVPSAGADDARMKALEEQVRSLAGEVALLRSELKEFRESKSPEQLSSPQLLLASTHPQPGTLASVPAPAAPQLAQTQTYGGATSNAKLLNPDISLIGDFIGTAGRNNVSPSPSLQMHETEVGMQAIIDPYARADAFLSFGETGVNVEEAYITFTSLPAGLLLKVGKMRADFGKVNTIHNHALPFIDRPLVTNNLVGGEDGIDDLGISYARGHNNAAVNTIFDPSHFLTNLYSADATLRWKPLRRAIYHSFLFRTELFWSARDQLSPLNIFQTQHAFGLYSDSEYRVNRRWTVGGRFDRSGRATNASLTDTGFSGILTYWPSEFSQVRGQYRYGHLWDVPNARFTNANEFLFQFLFVMGAHGAHPF